jgi:hypothetical protein
VSLAEGPDFDLVAASLRADSADLEVFVEALGTKLSASFPGRVTVERKGGRLSRGPHPVRLIAVPLGDAVFELRHDAGRVECFRRAVVRGIALRTDELPLGDWIDELSHALVAEASSSEQGRAALAQLLG